MCRATPARVTGIDGDLAWIDIGGEEQQVSLLAVEGVRVGDYVYHHAGLALARIDPEDAEDIFAAIAELDALYGPEGE